MNIKVEICTEGVSLPFYANEGDAGMDIRSAVDMIIAPQQTVVIPTGLKMAIPKGYELQVRARSGLSLNTPLRISNGIGTIDSGFRDEIGIIVTNTSMKTDNDQYTIQEAFYTDSKGNNHGSYIIRKGDRIAQIVLNQIPTIEFELVEDVKNFGIDRNGGLGSTGTK